MPWSSVYKKYEDKEMINAAKMMQITEQEKPPYRPKKTSSIMPIPAPTVVKVLSFLCNPYPTDSKKTR